MTNIRYYMGRHKVKIILRNKRKQLIEHLEKGYVGNKNEGYKNVKPGEIDVAITRNCRVKRNE